jgi:hypothetical protein
MDRQQLVGGGIGEDLTRGHAVPSWEEDLDRALDELVGTTGRNDRGAAVAEEIVNDLKNRLAIGEWRDLPCPPPPRPPSSHPDRTYTGWRYIRTCTSAPPSPSPSYLSTVVSATVMNVPKRLVRAAAQPGLMTGLA